MSIVRRTSTTGERRYDVRLRDPSGRVYTHTFRTKKAAESYVASERANRDRGAWLDPRNAARLFSDVAADWMASNPAKRPTTEAIDEVSLRKHIVPRLGARKIGSVSPPDIQRLVNEWIDAGTAPRTVRRRYGVVRAVFSYAVVCDWIMRTPCRGIHLPQVTDTRRMNLDAIQIARIAEATDPRYRPMVWMGAILGLRWSETAGLRVGRVDLDELTVRITEVVTRNGQGDPVVGPPKSATSARTLAIPQALGDILAKHLLDEGLSSEDGNTWLFEAPGGGPLRYANWRNRVWLPAAKAAGCAGAGFHDLRRAAATVLVAGGVDVRTAQARLGHSDPRITLAIYAQAVAEADRRAAETVAAAFLPGDTSEQP